jgi:arsenic resistance protein ArsH
MTEEAARLLRLMGAETRIFKPEGIPVSDEAEVDHWKVQDLRTHARWAEGMVCCSPEIHGSMSGLMKLQLDWLPATDDPRQSMRGKTLAVMQVSGGQQSFNAVNQMRLVGRWLRMITVPAQVSIARVEQEFSEDGRMRPSALYDRLVDVIEELFKLTLLTRDATAYLADCYSERKKRMQEPGAPGSRCAPGMAVRDDIAPPIQLLR